MEKNILLCATESKSLHQKSVQFHVTKFVFEENVLFNRWTINLFSLKIQNTPAFAGKISMCKPSSKYQICYIIRKEQYTYIYFPFY
jgi:hypothetical protein